MNRTCAWMVAVAVLGLGCTEPNPNAMGAESNGDSTSVASSTEGMTTTPDPTATTSMTSATTAVDTTATETGVDTTMGTDPTGDPTGDASSTGDPVCAAGTHVCVAETPVGWTGPVALLPSDGAAKEPACEGEWGELSGTAFTDLQASAAVCDCECAESANATCSTITLTRHANNDNDCSAVQATWNTGTACAAMPASSPDMQEAGNAHYWQAFADVSSGTCAPMPTEEIAPAAFSARTSLCAAPAGTSVGCEATEQCLPIPAGPYDGRICIWQAGDLECPDGAFTERTLLHQDIADDRDCSACTCGDPSGECHGTLSLANASNCGGQLVINVPIDSADCTIGVSGLSTLGAVVNGGLTADNPTCPPSNSSPIGDAEAIDPITVCCLP